MLRSALRKMRPIVSTPTGGISVLFFVVFITLAIIGPPIWGGVASRIDTTHAFEGPSSHAWSGTDQLGRDVFARTVAATRLSLELASIATLIAVVLGVPAGAVAGILDPRWRKFAARAIQLALAMPGILVALFLVAIIGPSSIGATIAIGVALAPLFARTAQTMTAGIADSEYLAAARVIGVRRRRILWRYLLPNTAEPLLLQIGVGTSLALIAISALSFLGLGVQSPSYDWGRVLNDGLQAIYTTPSAAITPGVAIVIAGLTFNLFGEALARAINPRLQQPRPLAEEGDRPSLAVVHSESQPRVRRAASGAANPLVVVDDLRISFQVGGEDVEAVAGVSFELDAGEIVGLVGESGSGKSLTALSLAGLAPLNAQVEAKRLQFGNRDLLSLSRRERRRLLATDLAVVFQDPMSSLNPSMRVGRQLSEKVEVHLGFSRKRGLALAEAKIAETHIPAARQRISQYPFEFSGGMRQRAMIAMGLMTEPAFIIADEPTTALDVTVQAQVLKLFREINERSGTTILLISHDLAVVSELCSRVMVMYAGRIVESLPTSELSQAAHPYTRALLGTVIDLETDKASRLVTIPGLPPTLGRDRDGCPFAPRCEEAIGRCQAQDPPLDEFSGDRHLVACWARSRERSRVGVMGAI